MLFVAICKLTVIEELLFGAGSQWCFIEAIISHWFSVLQRGSMFKGEGDLEPFREVTLGYPCAVLLAIYGK